MSNKNFPYDYLQVFQRVRKPIGILALILVLWKQPPAQANPNSWSKFLKIPQIGRFWIGTSLATGTLAATIKEMCILEYLSSDKNPPQDGFWDCNLEPKEMQTVKKVLEKMEIPHILHVVIKKHYLGDEFHQMKTAYTNGDCYNRNAGVYFSRDFFDLPQHIQEGIIAHEAAHMKYRDGLNHVSTSLATKAFMGLGLTLMGIKSKRLPLKSLLASGVAYKGGMSLLHKNAERRADIEGSRAVGSHQGLIDFFEKVAKKSKSGGKKFSWTHPSHLERVNYLKEDQIRMNSNLSGKYFRGPQFFPIPTEKKTQGGRKHRNLPDSRDPISWPSN